VRREILDFFHVPPERIRVAHPAPAPVFAAHGERAEVKRPYVLTVATLEPRKNLETLLDAHELLDGEFDLAVVGAAGWGPQPRLDRSGVTRLGYVDDTAFRPIAGVSVRLSSSRASAFRCSRQWRAASGRRVGACLDRRSVR
jgi:glycosyltransferase involved in cell wall biosynthesis